ncbi:MAG: beta-lactamase family protein [Candidatus Dormibacteraeota bacterium]|nr:beta-lactamase family protein [Candidatus Dormibacteraeota bacterium]
MTQRARPSGGPMTRRSVLRLLGAPPLVAAGAAALPQPAGASASSEGGPASAPPPALRPGGAFDRYLSGLAAQDQFSGTVLLAWQGKPTLVRGFQDADKANHIPNRADTIFTLASVTKLLTGVAVAQLAAEGKVDFSATLGTYLNGFPADIANTVTVHNLMTHTSGFPGSEQAPSGNWATRDEAFEGTLASLRQQQLVAAPGTTYAYSNANYFLAGAIVASASGQAYWDYMPRRVFGPAGMTSTAFYADQQWLSDPRFAHVYGPPLTGGQRQDLTPEAAPGTPNGWDGSGGAFSTVLDLLNFANALADGTLLPPPWAEWRAGGRYPVSPASNDPDAPSTSRSFMIGYGSDERITSQGQRAYGHSGGLLLRASGSTQPGGGTTALTIYPDLGAVAVILSNYSLNAIGGISAVLAEQDSIVTQQGS